MYFTQEDYKKIESWLLKNSVKDSDFQEAFSLKGKETVVVTQDGHNRKITVEDLSSELIKLGVSGFVNVSENFDVFGINLEEAIVLIPLTSRKRGIVITFYNTQGYWELYQFSGALNQWNNITLWKEIGKGTDTNNLATKEELNAKQDTISDLEAIRSGAALGATAIQSVKTINGQSVEGEGNITIEGGGSNITVDSKLSDTSENPVQNKVIYENLYGMNQQYIQMYEEQNRIFTNAINNVNTELLNKVDYITGKQLSTEDFTTALKTKLEGLNNYDDTSIQNAVNSLTTQINTLVSGDASTAIESFNEIIAFLNGVEDSESLDSIIAAIEQQIAGKQDKLVSGTNIKTINGESILGEGNITIKGGGVSEEYVNNAIASAITNTLNTAV